LFFDHRKYSIFKPLEEVAADYYRSSIGRWDDLDSKVKGLEHEQDLKKLFSLFLWILIFGFFVNPYFRIFMKKNWNAPVISSSVHLAFFPCSISSWVRNLCFRLLSGGLYSFLCIRDNLRAGIFGSGLI